MGALTVGDLRKLIKDVDDEHIVYVYDSAYADYDEAIRAFMVHDFPLPSFLDENRKVDGLLIR